jgi:hypothetical protein
MSVYFDASQAAASLNRTSGIKLARRRLPAEMARRPEHSFYYREYLHVRFGVHFGEDYLASASALFLSSNRD